MKRVHEQSYSSSSEDEISADILNDAIDKQFLSDDLYTKEKNKIIPQSELETSKPKSLRPSKRDDKFTNLGVTAEFQSYVAKKLDEILERTIKLTDSKTTECYIEQEEEKNTDSGIKLLSTSKRFLILGTEKEHKEKPKKHREIIENDNDLSKFQEAAVCPEHILNKSDKKIWAGKHSEPEFKYKKLKDGTLMEI